MPAPKRKRQRENRLIASRASGPVVEASRRGRRAPNRALLVAEMFSLGARALSHLWGTDGVYACPICFRNFTDVADPDLSVEHAPPLRIGGREIALTCKKPCNNDFRPDAALDKYENSVDYFRSVPGSMSKGYIVDRSSSMPVHVRVDEQGDRSLEILGRQTAVDEFQTGLNDTFVVAHPLPEFNGGTALAYLKSGYLALFAKFGYSWASCERLIGIRNELRSPGTDPEFAKLVIFTNGPSKRQILQVVEPVQCFAVHWDWVVVFLPCHEGTGDLVSEMSRLRACGTFRVRVNGVIDYPIKVEFHWDLHHLPIAGPYIGTNECDGKPSHFMFVGPCEVLGNPQTERFSKIQTAPFRAQRVFDTPTGVVGVISEDDFNRYCKS